MVPEASSNPSRSNHLRLVGGEQDNQVQSERKHIQTDGLAVLSPAQLRAEAIRKEADLFREARGVKQALTQSVPRPETRVTEGEGQVELGDLGARYEALAPRQAPSAAPGVERLDAAIEALQASSPLEVFPELWPAVHLSALAAQDPSSAGRWVIALLSLFHRVTPTGLIDLRMASGQVIRAAALGDETRLSWTAQKSRSVPFVKCTEARLAEIALGRGRRVRRTQRNGATLIRSLAAAPLALGDLGQTYSSVIDPFAFWQMIRIARPAVLDGIASRISHSDPSRPAYDVTIDLIPGRPVKIQLGRDDEADAHIETCLLYTSPSPRDQRGSRMPSSA